MAGPTTLLTIVLHVVVLALPSRAWAGGGEMGPSDAEMRQAQRLAATFRQVDGIARAVRTLCRGDRQSPPHVAAYTVLVERAAAAMPNLLDTMAASEASGAEDHDEIIECAAEAERIAADGVCTGRVVGDNYGIDRRSEQVAERSRDAAQRALISALAKPGARRRAAIGVFLVAPEPAFAEHCPGGANLLQLATPALVEMLSSKDHEDEILRLFGSGNADLRVAIPAVRPYLADKKRLIAAATALARMGDDVSSAVAPLGELLDGPEAEAALQALVPIGPRARAVLPRLVALWQRMDATCTKPVVDYRLVEAIAAVATRADDAKVALQTFSAMLWECSSTSAIAPALDGLGGDGWLVLQKYLRDEDNAIEKRLDVADAMRRGSHKLDAADEVTVHALQAKANRYQSPPTQLPVPEPVRDPLKSVVEEVTACRAEAGLKPVAVTGVSAPQADAVQSCLHHYLCGPSPRTLARTLDRCCARAFGAHQPAFCRP